MADSFIQLPPDSTGKKLDTDELTVGANTVQRQRVIAIPPRADLVPGRVLVRKSNNYNNSSALVHTVAAGKNLYLVQLSVMIYNMDNIVHGNLILWDNTVLGGTALRRYMMPPTPTGSAAAVILDSVSFVEPLLVDNGIYVEKNSGNLTFVISLVGYEE